jgi:hypothetical protein
MIRRAFWLGAGAAIGIMGYRRVAAAGRKVSEQNVSRTALRAARESWRFSRDVREGMELYTARHSARALEKPQSRRILITETKDGR